MAAFLPQAATPPGVAFEIPIKKNVEDSPPVHKRLVEHSTSPKKPLDLQDISKKLAEANKRREDIANDAISKTSLHNYEVAKVGKKSKARAASEVELLESRIALKLDNAEAKREDMTKNWVQRLSKSTKNKLLRGKRSVLDADAASSKLGNEIEKRGVSADLRREGINNGKSQELAAINDSKIRRGILARELAQVEAKRLENQIERKIASANLRRDMKNSLVSVRISDSLDEKKERAADARRREQVETAKAGALIDIKMKHAGQRKEELTAEKVEKISTEVADKLRRGADSLADHIRRTNELREDSEKKVATATKRRDSMLRKQQESLNLSSAKKERLVSDKQKEHDRAARLLQKNIHSRLLSTSHRKEEILQSKAAKVAESTKKKKYDAATAYRTQLERQQNEAVNLEIKMRTAATRKEMIAKEVLSEMKKINQSKLERKELIQKQAKIESAMKFAEIEKKVAVASANRENSLANIVAKSSSKKRVMSPRASPSKGEIEARINQAAARREMFLMNRAGKGSPKSSPSVSRTNLFAAVTPGKGDEDVSPGFSPGIKAARLQEFHMTDSEVKVEQSTFMQLVAAIVLVGVFSFCSYYKH